MSRPVHLPRSAPFGEEERASLDSILAGKSATQLAWLSGFLAGLDADAGRALPAPVPVAAEPLTILFASESGNTERLAHDAAAQARKLGLKPVVTDLADADLSTLAQARRLLVIASTWGEGEPPARAARNYKELMEGEGLRLDGVRFSVLALGDSAYVEFCAIGKALDARLEALGGVRVADRVDCDLDFDTPALEWTKQVLDRLKPAPAAATNVVPVDFGARSGGDAARARLSASATALINLNSSRSTKQTFHLELDFDASGLAYEPGDALELFAPNDPELVRSVIKAAGLGTDEALAETLRTERDVTTLSLPLAERYAAIVEHAGLRRMIARQEIRGWIEGRQLLDLLEAFRGRLEAAQLIELTRPLPPRAYSIASSLEEIGSGAHLLVAPVRYESHGRWRAGVASTHVADRMKVGDRIDVRLRANRHFRLPDPATDIIMIGPGTGIAPFRAFVQERRAAGATGRAWLFFGDRQYTHDFLYQLEWQQALRDGFLSRIDLAFSRDTPEKVYVQHRLWERRREVVDWLDGGAHLYLCGDAKQMAKDVRATLVRAIADVKSLGADAAEAAVADLEKECRFLQDIY